MKSLNLDQFLEYRFLSNVRYCPDGSRAAFVVSTANKGENSYDACLYLYENGAVRQLTGLNKESLFFWEDDTHILFPACRLDSDKKRAEAGEIFTKYYRIAVDGGEAQPAFELPVQAGELHSFGNGKYFFTSVIDCTKPDAYLDDKDTRAETLKEKKENDDYIVLSELPFYFNGSTFRNNRREALFIADIDSGSVKRISEPLVDVDKAVFTNGKIYYVAEKYTGHSSNKSGLFEYNPDTDRTKVLFPDSTGYLQNIEPYGNNLLFFYSDGKTYSYEETPFIYIFDTETGSRTLLNENVLDIGNSSGSDCRFGGGYRLRVNGTDAYYLATVRDRCSLYRLDAKGSVSPAAENTGSVDCFDVNINGEILCVAMLHGKLQELYKLENGSYVQISSFNEKVLEDRYVSGYEKLTVRSEGEDIDGWILKPMDYDPAKTYPAILDIHGGPRTIYSDIFYHEMQYWAGQGYFVFFCNPIGSDGRGDAFADIRGKYGTVEYKNIMDFTDAVLEKYPQIDKARVGVTGGSYGGFMTNWIIGHTHRFCAAATQRSISNWTSFYGTSDIGPWFGSYQNNATYTRNHELMWRQSPIAYADYFETPTLIIHSDEDYRCPISEGYQLLTALQERNVESRMVVFKGENHELSRGGKPLHRIRRLSEISAWMDKFCK